MNWIDRYFEIKSKGSSVRTEILAGSSTFLALSYIFIVNPAILSQAGMNKSSVLFATILISGLATLVMGLWARLPFVLAPGMEMNAYVSYFVVGALGFTWQEALGAVFWSGVLFVILSVSRIRERMIDAIPERMKSSLSLSVGVFLALVAFKIAGILHYEGVRIVGFGSFTSPVASALYVSLALVLALNRIRVPGAVMISIVLTTFYCYWAGIMGDADRAAPVSLAMLSGVGKFLPSVILRPRIFSAILILFLLDFYGSIAKLIGLTRNTSIMHNGVLPRLREALLIDSVGTTVGSALGTSSITVYVESGVGIGAGGRSGLTAVVCGSLMLACFALAPFLHFIPLVAATGPLLFVAKQLCPSANEIRSMRGMDILSTMLMQVVVVATFAVDRAMLAGFLVYIAASGRRQNPYLVGSTLLLTAGTALQLLGK